MSKKANLFSLGLIACLMLLGCDRDKKNRELQNFVAETLKTPAQPIEPLPIIKTVDKFSYPNDAKRNPFAKVVERNYKGLQPDTNRPKEPLEAYTLDSLKMVGVLTEQQKTWGIIVAPDNTVYRVRVGSYLGQNYGKVVAINPNKIKILEIVLQDNDWLERESFLVLK